MYILKTVEHIVKLLPRKVIPTHLQPQNQQMGERNKVKKIKIVSHHNFYL